MTSERIIPEESETNHRSVPGDAYTIELISDEKGSNELDDPKQRRVSGKDPLGMYMDDLYVNGEPLLSAEQEVEVAMRIEAGLAAAAMLESRLPRIDKVDDEELEWLADDGQKARNELVEKNVRLAVSIAKKYGRAATSSMNMADIVSEANLGLFRAVEKFDYTKGYKFSTYATWWIRQGITRALAEKSRTIKLSVHIVEDLNKIRKTQSAFLTKHDREATIEELADACELTVKRVMYVLDAEKTQPTSLNAPLGEDGKEFGDLISDGYDDEVLDAAIAGAGRDMVVKAIEMLDPRAAEVIKRRYGFYGEIETLDTVGERHGRTRERIRQIEARAKQDLTRLLRSLASEGTVIPETKPARNRGTKLSYDPMDYVERGKEILHESEADLMLTIAQVGNVASAARQLRIDSEVLHGRVRAIRKKVDEESGVSQRKPAKPSSEKSIGKREQKRLMVADAFAFHGAHLDDDDAEIIKSYLDSSSGVEAAQRLGISYSGFNVKFRKAQDKLSSLQMTEESA